MTPETLTLAQFLEKKPEEQKLYREVTLYDGWDQPYTAYERIEPVDKPLNPANVEMRSQVHLMDAEGAEDFKPTEAAIVAYLKSEGYEGVNIDISFDNMQQLWRWNCDIKPIPVEPLATLKVGDEQPRYSAVFRHSDGKTLTSYAYSLDELLETDLLEIQEKTCDLCECQPVGETNIIECNCQEYTDDFKFIGWLPDLCALTPAPPVETVEQETAEHAAEKHSKIHDTWYRYDDGRKPYRISDKAYNSFKAGAKWQAESNAALLSSQQREIEELTREVLQTQSRSEVNKSNYAKALECYNNANTDLNASREELARLQAENAALKEAQRWVPVSVTPTIEEYGDENKEIFLLASDDEDCITVEKVCYDTEYKLFHIPFTDTVYYAKYYCRLPQQPLTPATPGK